MCSGEQSDMATPKTSVNNLPSQFAVGPVFSVSNPPTRVQNPFQMNRISEYQPAVPLFLSSQNIFAPDQTAKINFIIANMVRLDSIEAHQTLMMARLDTINAKVNENKILIYKTNSNILEFESSQKCMSDKHNQVHTSSNTNNEHIHRIQGELKSLVQDNAYLQSDSSQFN